MKALWANRCLLRASKSLRWKRPRLFKSWYLGSGCPSCKYWVDASFMITFVSGATSSCFTSSRLTSTSYYILKCYLSCPSGVPTVTSARLFGKTLKLSVTSCSVSGVTGLNNLGRDSIELSCVRLTSPSSNSSSSEDWNPGKGIGGFNF